MKFYTDSGSAYELDRDGSKIRRLAGEDNPTPRQGKDGEWRVFDFCSEVVAGVPVVINWEDVRCTVTSPVKMILPDGPAN